MKLVFLIIVGFLFFLAPPIISDITFFPQIEHKESVKEKPHYFSIIPTEPKQGDPILISFASTSRGEIKSLTIGTKQVSVFDFENSTAALFGFDLGTASGEYLVKAVFTDGQVASSTILLLARERREEPLGIPQKLGGNTQQSQNQLVSSLSSENQVLADIESATDALWNEPFIAPLASTTITDTYGYVRLTGAYSIPHKGIDFRAEKGTPVLAMNKGVVRLAKEFRIYGKTLVIDHGLGLQTFYMHLSDFAVALGDSIERGEVIAWSGESGYAERPHLHLSVRIGGISIDPLVFLSLFSKP